MYTGPHHSNGMHNPPTLNSGGNRSNKGIISPLAAAAIAGEAAVGDAATQECLISRERTCSKAPSKQVDSATSNNSKPRKSPRRIPRKSPRMKCTTATSGGVRESKASSY